MYFDVGPGDVIQFSGGAVGVCIKIEKTQSDKDLLTLAHPDGELAFFDAFTVQEMLEKGIWTRIERA